MTNINKYEFKRVEIPVDRQFTDKILKLWESVFQGNSFTFLENSLLGNELNTSKNVLYFVTYENMIVSTLRLIHSKSDNRLGYLGEAATLPEHRGNKLMGSLLQQAIHEFIENNGQGLFLATANPIARRTYQRYGFNNLNGYETGVMIREKNGKPDVFISKYFDMNKQLKLKIEPMSSLDRVTMVPFIIKRHEWIVLDSNLQFVSSKYYAPCSCEGLYVRCQDFQRKQNSCFVLRRSDGAIVGFASVAKYEDNSCCVEAFTIGYYQDQWLHKLYKTVIDYATDKGCTYQYTTCAKDDNTKKQVLEELGFELTQKSTKLETSQYSIDLAIFSKL